MNVNAPNRLDDLRHKIVIEYQKLPHRHRVRVLALVLDLKHERRFVSGTDSRPARQPRL